MHPVFFTHIPKTAGTSFRLGVEDYLGQKSIIYDYGLKEKETSDIVRELLYGEISDPWRFYQECHKQEIRFVGGHVGIGRFVSGFKIENSVTFVREPLQRILSDFKHFVRHYGFKGTFAEFYSKPVMQNRQSQFLGGVALEAIGIIGLTERYEESIELINSKFEWLIPARKDNNSVNFLTNFDYEISKVEENELRRLNQKDLDLYNHCTEIFDTRIKLYRDGLRFSHAQIQQVSEKSVFGWAWWGNESDDPVEVELLVNGQPIQKRLATELRPGLCWIHPPRGAHVGFSFPNVAKVGDTVQCRIAETGQCFPSKPIIVTDNS